jgi:hypothetical protein
LPAGSLAVVLAPAEAPAGVAASLVVATIRLAARGSVSASIETLTQGVLHAMLLSKLKVAGVFVFVAGFVGLGAGGWVYQSRAVGQTPKSEPAPSAQRSPYVRPASPSEDHDRKQRVKKLVDQLAEALADDSSGDAAQMLQDLLRSAQDRRAKREQEVQAALATVAKDIAVLKQAVAGDPAREKVITEFEAAFQTLTKRLDARAAAAATDGGSATTFDRFSAGYFARSYDFGSGVDPAAPRPDPRLFSTYDRGAAEQLGVVEKVNGKSVGIKLAADRGVAVGQVLSVVRLGDDPRFVGKVKVTAVTGKDAVGLVSDLGWQQKVKAGDQVMVEVQAR